MSRDALPTSSASLARESARQVFTQVQKVAGDEDAEDHPLRDITDLELEEIRQLKHPPETCARVMECVYLILADGPLPRLADGIEWFDVLKTVVKTDFLRRVRRYEVAQLREKPALVDRLCRTYLSGENALRPDRVYHSSRAIVAFFGWTVALIAEALPGWPVDEVGGAEARRHVELLEEERKRHAREKAAKQAEIERIAAERKQKAEEARLEAIRKTEEEEAARQEDIAKKLEEESKQAAARQEEVRKEQEAARQEELRKEQERLAVEVAAREMEKQRFELELAESLEEESGEEEEDPQETSDLCMWDFGSNPERRLLGGGENEVTFTSTDIMYKFCNVTTAQPILRGVHYFQFIITCITAEQWCGVTLDKSQEGSRVVGSKLRGWTYYSGQRHAKKGPPQTGALHVDGKVQKQLARYVENDEIGMIVDADLRSVAFLKNGELRGACALPANHKPLYVITHLGGSSDKVQIRSADLSTTPPDAMQALQSCRSIEPPQKSPKAARQSPKGKSPKAKSGKARLEAEDDTSRDASRNAYDLHEDRSGVQDQTLAFPVRSFSYESSHAEMPDVPTLSCLMPVARIPDVCTEFTLRTAVGSAIQIAKTDDASVEPATNSTADAAAPLPTSKEHRNLARKGLAQHAERDVSPDGSQRARPATASAPASAAASAPRSSRRSASSGRPAKSEQTPTLAVDLPPSSASSSSRARGLAPDISRLNQSRTTTPDAARLKQTRGLTTEASRTSQHTSSISSIASVSTRPSRSSSMSALRRQLPKSVAFHVPGSSPIASRPGSRSGSVSVVARQGNPGSSPMSSRPDSRGSSVSVVARQGNPVQRGALRACASLVMTPASTALVRSPDTSPKACVADASADSVEPSNCLEDWSSDAVCEFLRRSGLGMYEQTFRDECVDGSILACDLTEELAQKELGMKAIHAGKLFRELGKLQSDKA